MSERLRLDVDGRRGVLTFDTPGRSVNTLDVGAVCELERWLDVLEARRDLAGVVVRSAKPGSFLAGADLDELGALEEAAQAEHWLGRTQEALRRLAGLAAPTVAAIDGAALGGGLELALACTYRVATPGRATQLGLPEVQFGLLPAAGGTWRLPARVGVRRGFELLLGGGRLGAAEALAAGMVDEIAPTEVLLRAAERLLRERPRPRRGAPRWERWPLAGRLVREVAAGLAGRELARRTGDRLPAPRAILRAARHGPAAGGRRAEAVERREFGPLALSPESRALVGLFFATRAARPRGGVEEPLRVGVVGAGLMGGGIAQVAARRGHVVRLNDTDPRAIARSLAAAARAWRASERAHRMTRSERSTAESRLQAAPLLDALGACDVVIEAVVEELEVKRALFARLAARHGAATILASNTSTIPIARLASGLPAPERVLGLHFFSPVAKMPLVEIVRHEETSAEAIERARRFVAALGKTPIVVADGPGFYTSRVVGALTGQAAAMLDEGASVHAVDEAGRRAGFPVGPLTLLDEVGLDVAARAARTLRDAFPARFAPPDRLDEWVADGRLGRKSGQGFYSYVRGRKRVAAAAEPAARAVRASSAAERDETAERLRFSLAAEAVRCLEEGILASASDGDLGAVLGLGFPPETGGPFRWLDGLGAAPAVERLARLAERHGAIFAPPAMLRDLAGRGATFHAGVRRETVERGSR
jgi:3-hydroxyacyl-CoA dehydrogenase/enoyl-CoA hydratase/3-hydroxybutyryl-CoA epimerase